MSDTEESESRVIQPGRTVVVEPVVVLLAVFGFPLGLLTELFVVNRITQDVARSLNISLDNASSAASPCRVHNASDIAFKAQTRVQREAAFFWAMQALIMGFPALLSTLVLGPLSDHLGRKWAIAPPIAGTLLKSLCCVLVVRLDGSLWWLSVGAVLEGLGGFYIGTLMGCFSYIADTTTPERRMFRITVLEMCAFIAGLLGPLGVGHIISAWGFLWPLVLAASGFAINLLYVIFLVPETVHREPGVPISPQLLLPSWKLFTHDNGTGRRWKLAILLLALFVSSAVTLESGTKTLFQLNYPLCWDATTIGYYTAVAIVVSAVSGALLARLSRRCLKDHHLALLAGLASSLRCVYTAFVRNTPMMFAATALSGLSFLYIPSLRTLLSQLVSQHEQGAVFGAVAFVEVLCTMFGTSFFNAVYAGTVHLMPGLVFLVEAAFYLIGSLLLVYYVVRQHREKQEADKYQRLPPVEEENSPQD